MMLLDTISLLVTFESAIYYYEKGIAARNKIKQGDMLSEI